MLLGRTATGCTLFKVSDGERVLFGNNEDWSDPNTQVWFRPATASAYGRMYFGFTNYVGQGGMNDQGLCYDWWAWGIHAWQSDPAKATLARFPCEVMLETCATVDDAIAFYQRTNEQSFSGATILVTDRAGNSVQMGFRNGAFFADRGTRAQVIGYAAATVNRLLGSNAEVSLENVASILDQARQYGTYSTQYSNVYDPAAGVVYVYDFRRSATAMKIQLAAELAKGEHTLALPLTAEKLGYPTSDPFDLPAPTVPGETRLINLAVRSVSGLVGDVLIGGFVLEGPAPHAILIRGSGPALTDFDVAHPIADPSLHVFLGSDVLVSNDDWQGTPALRRAFAATGAFPWPAASLDAAVVARLPPRAYTVHLRPSGATAGVGLLEVYDADPAAPSRLINISARARVRTAEGMLIVGFVMAGNAPAKILLRGVGPSLSGWVPDALPDGELRLFRHVGESRTEIAANDDWGDTAELRAAFARTGGVPFAATSKDSALLVDLSPGTYSAQLRGVNDATGVALIELFHLPPGAEAQGAITFAAGTTERE